MLDRYQNVRQSVLKAVEQMRGLAEVLAQVQCGEVLDAIRDKIEQDRFHLVVMGQFKRGKTTFINALLGRDLLPTAVVPLTSIVTIITYGRAVGTEVLFQDGRRQEISPTELPAYVTERGNPENRKGVKQVEVHLPEPALREGLCLIDTPGVGSTYHHNTDVAYRFLPQVDAGIFLVSADPPIGQAEFEFLRDLRQHAQKLFFVQNKIDYLGDRERQESLAFTTQVIAEQLRVDKLHVFPISAKQALEAKLRSDREALTVSGLPELEQVLADFLLREKGRLLIESAIQNALKAAGDLELALELERKAITMPVLELAKKVQALGEHLHRIEQEGEESLYLLTREVERLVRMVEEDLQRLVEEALPRLEQRIGGLYREHRHEAPRALARFLFAELSAAIEAIFDPWRAAEEAKVAEGLEAALSRYAARANRAIAEIRAVAADLFNLPVDTFPATEPLSTESRFYYKTEDSFALALDQAAFILPPALSRQIVWRQIRAKCAEELSRNAGRVREDFQDRLDRTVLRFRTSFAQRILATAEAVRLALQRGKGAQADGEEVASRRLQHLEEQLHALQQVKADLLDQRAALAAEGTDGH